MLTTLRSSSAALHEHLLGTTSAMTQFGIDASFKAARTRGMLSKLDRLAGEGPPDVSSLSLRNACLAHRSHALVQMRVALSQTSIEQLPS